MTQSQTSLPGRLLECNTEEEVKSEFARTFKLKLDTRQRMDLYTQNILYEFKYERNLNQLSSRAQFVAQLLYYVRELKFGTTNLSIPKVLCVVDKNEAFFVNTLACKTLYDSSDLKFDWDRAASTPCPNVTTGVSSPIIVITTEGGLSAINADWNVDDVILDTAGPAEVEARIRIALGNSAAQLLATNPNSHEIRSGDVVIDERTYTAKLKGRVLDLTFKEFELLKYLAQHPGRVFTRSQLLQEIWGYDYFGGTRTVDVHIRRLRSKLGPEFEAIIGTVRNVGYRFSTSSDNATADLS